MTTAGLLAALAAVSAVILSVVPPHGALALAREVAAAGFRGVSVDANAVAPWWVRPGRADLVLVTARRGQAAAWGAANGRRRCIRRPALTP